MGVGTGVVHNEYTASDEETVNFLQIWIQPNAYGIEPGYEQKAYHNELNSCLRLVASTDRRDNFLTIHQYVCIYPSRLKSGEQVEHRLAPERPGYRHVARGEVTLNELELSGGNGAALQKEEIINLRAGANAEVLLFDLP